MRRVIMMTASVLALASPVGADEASDKLEQELKQQTELATVRKDLVAAQTALIDSQAGLVKAQFDALGLTPATGTTTLKDNAGAIEAAMLNAGSAQAAADALKIVVGDRKVLLLAGDQAVDLSLPAVVAEDAGELSSALNRATGAACPAGAIAPLVPLVPLIGAALSLLRTDTEISGVKLEPKASQLLNAVAARLVPNVILLEDVVVQGPATVQPGSVGAAIKQLKDASQAAFECSKTKAPTNDDLKVKRAVLDATLARAAEWSAAMKKADAAGSSLLGRALRLDAVKAEKPLILRVYTEAAGGSLLKRGNIWTALGAPAVGLTGGLVVSYRLSDPASGNVKNAGVLVCRTALTDMRAVQAGRSADSNCVERKPGAPVNASVQPST